MFRFAAACLFAFAAIGLSQPAFAQSQNSADPSGLSKEHLDLARQVFVASQTGRSFDEILPTLADRAKTTFIQTNPQMQLGIIEVVDRVALDMVQNRKDLDDSLVRVWALAFQPDELKTILEFYQSPAGEKFALNYPKVLSTQLAASDDWTREISNELGQRVARELQRMVKTDAKDLQGGTSPQSQ